MRNAYQIIRRPMITEKNLVAKETSTNKTTDTLVFEMNVHASKTEIRNAVQSIFKIKVNSVHTANFEDKERRRGKFADYRPNWKKAYVRLKAGEKMPEYADNI